MHPDEELFMTEIRSCFCFSSCEHALDCPLVLSAMRTERWCEVKTQTVFTHHYKISGIPLRWLQMERKRHEGGGGLDMFLACAAQPFEWKPITGLTHGPNRTACITAPTLQRPGLLPTSTDSLWRQWMAAEMGRPIPRGHSCSSARCQRGAFRRHSMWALCITWHAQTRYHSQSRAVLARVHSEEIQ